MKGISIRDITRGHEPMSYRLRDRAQSPAIGDQVVVMMPDGTSHRTIVSARLFGAMRYECLVGGKPMQFRDDEVEMI